MDIIEYKKDNSEKWDKFVLENSANGTFLQTREFLSYHPKGRFQDASVLVEDKGKIIAVCPACAEEIQGKKVFVSHKGSTYGGIVVAFEVYKTEKVINIIDVVERHLRGQGYEKLIYKITPDIFCRERSDLLSFCLKRAEYKENQELSFYIDYEHYKKDVIQNFNKGRRCNVKNCMRMGMSERHIYEDADLKEFYDLLCGTLKKYDTAPVHSYNELLLLRDMFEKEISFMGIYLAGKMVAGTMLFYFEQTNCIHTQYLAADTALEKISPMSFLYYSVIKYAMALGCRYLSWGIATDHAGNLNNGLIQAKEAVGSRQAINRIFEKEL